MHPSTPNPPNPSNPTPNSSPPPLAAAPQPPPLPYAPPYAPPYYARPPISCPPAPPKPPSGAPLFLAAGAGGLAAFAFLTMPFVTDGLLVLSGPQTIFFANSIAASENIPGRVANVFAILWVIPLAGAAAATIALLAAYLRPPRVAHFRVGGIAAGLAGLIGLIPFLFMFAPGSESGSPSILQFAGTGFWTALAGLVAVIVFGLVAATTTR